MTLPFNRISSDVRVPLFYAEIDPSRNTAFQITQRALLIGQKLVAGLALAGSLILIGNVDEARAQFGAGSQLAAMVATYKLNDPLGQVWCLPLADAGGSTAATGTVTFAGTATENGTVSLYIAGRRVQQGVTSGQAAAAVATALAASINADTLLPVTASVGGAVVTLTARNAGTLGNDIDVRVNYLGLAGGERNVAGLTPTIVAMSGGATDPAIGTALAVLGDLQFDWVASPYSDTTSLDAKQTEWGDVQGRWAWTRQVYGHVYTAKRGTLGALASFGTARNDPHISCMGFNNSPSPIWVWASAFAAQAATSLRIDPHRPLHTLPLLGVLAPPPSSVFTLSENNTMLYDGISTFMVDDAGVVRIGRAISMYRLNIHGQPDQSFLDVTTTASLQYLMREQRLVITQKYGRCKLADDGTRLGPGQATAVATPKLIRAELIALYSKWESEGRVENMRAFKDHLIVERNANDPTRIDVSTGPDLVNPLHIFAVLTQFRLQYPAAA